MQAAFWHERWQHNQIGFHLPATNPLLTSHWDSLGVATDSRVFVPLCGKSLDLLWLHTQGHSVVGAELSPLAVRDFFAENRLTPHTTQQGAFTRWESAGITLLQGDFFNLGAADLAGCTAVYDRAALIALPPPMRQQYAKHLHALLPHAPILLITLEYDQGEMQGPPFAVPEEEVQALYGANYNVDCLTAMDALEDDPKFRARLSYLTEKVYRLQPKP